MTVYEASNRVLAEGNVVFDQGEQRITGSRSEWNYATKLGYFINSTGFTNQTQDGTVITFTADSVEKVSINTIVIINAELTACEDSVPKWSFKTRRAEINKLRPRTIQEPDIPRQEHSDYLFAVCVDLAQAARPCVRVLDADLQWFRQQRLSNLKCLLSDAWPLCRRDDPTGYLYIARPRIRRGLAYVPTHVHFSISSFTCAGSSLWR